jgi:hypothetical protein
MSGDRAGDRVRGQIGADFPAGWATCGGRPAFDVVTGFWPRVLQITRPQGLPVVLAVDGTADMLPICAFIRRRLDRTVIERSAKVSAGLDLGRPRCGLGRSVRPPRHARPAGLSYQKTIVKRVRPT